MSSCPWSDHAPGTISFCEAKVCAWIVEPSNAWSNLAYVLAGILILRLAQRRAPLVLIGVAAILIGIGSFLFHGTGTRWGELLDVSAMYLLSGLALAFLLRRLVPMSTLGFVGGYVAVVAASVLCMIALRTNGILVFAAQITAAVSAETYLYLRRPHDRYPSYRHQTWMVASFALAFTIWNLDKWSVLCDPDNHLVTGHAIWHVLTAVAIVCFAMHQQQRLA